MMLSQPSKKAHRIGTVHHRIDQRTAAVRVDRQVRHPKYGKSYRRTTKLLVEVAPSFELKAGDVVVIEATRPISKRKSWQVIGVQKPEARSQKSERVDDAISDLRSPISAIPEETV